MFKRTKRLQELFEKYSITDLVHGAKEDKMGDVIEDYCVSILNSTEILSKYKANCINKDDTDEFIFFYMMSKIPIDSSNIIKIFATRDIKHRFTGGNPKTDIIIEVHCVDTKVITVPISIKSSTVSKVAMAEFDVDTIVREVGIGEVELKNLLLKHQIDASAKNFTKAEKEKLYKLLTPYARKFVRWVLAGSPVESEDLRFPVLMIKFALTKTDEIKDIKIYSIEEYVNSVMLDKNKNIKKGGFGTGLSWTYATGSKGKKIQFKG